jgi:hypothetical protein
MASGLMRALLTTARTTIPPSKAPNRILVLVLALMGRLRTAAKPDSQVLGASAKNSAKTRVQPDRSAVQNQAIALGPNTCGERATTGACRRRDEADRGGARRKAKGARAYSVAAACAFMQEVPPRRSLLRNNAPLRLGQRAPLMGGTKRAVDYLLRRTGECPNPARSDPRRMQVVGGIRRNIDALGAN